MTDDILRFGIFVGIILVFSSPLFYLKYVARNQEKLGEQN